nr:MAG TPA: hypothetical protein [Caudoviricetes sp.]
MGHNSQPFEYFINLLYYILFYFLKNIPFF